MPTEASVEHVYKRSNRSDFHSQVFQGWRLTRMLQNSSFFFLSKQAPFSPMKRNPWIMIKMAVNRMGMWRVGSGNGTRGLSNKMGFKFCLDAMFCYCQSIRSNLLHVWALKICRPTYLLLFALVHVYVRLTIISNIHASVYFRKLINN